jgi:hypothetical protein
MNKFRCLGTAALLALGLAPATGNAAFILIDDLIDTLTGSSDFGGFAIDQDTETVTFKGTFTSNDPNRPMPNESAKVFTAGLYSDGFFVTPFNPGLNCAAEIGTTNCLSDFVEVTLNGIRDSGVGTGTVSVVLQFLSNGTIGDPCNSTGGPGTTSCNQTLLEDGRVERLIPTSAVTSLSRISRSLPSASLVLLLGMMVFAPRFCGSGASTQARSRSQRLSGALTSKPIPSQSGGEDFATEPASAGSHHFLWCGTGTLARGD